MTQLNAGKKQFYNILLNFYMNMVLMQQTPIAERDWIKIMFSRLSKS